MNSYGVPILSFGGGGGAWAPIYDFAKIPKEVSEILVHGEV